MGANAHSRIRALGPDRVSQIDSMLVKGKSCAEIARMIQGDWGLYQDMKFETLAREIRMYRKDQIDIPMAGRQLAISRSKNPAVTKQVLKRADDYDAHARWFKLIRAQEDRVWKWLDSGAGNLPASAVREDMKVLHVMYQQFTDFLIKTGVISKTPEQATIRAEYIVVDEHNVNEVANAVLEYLNRNEVELGEFTVDRIRHAKRGNAAREVMRILRGEDEPLLLEHQDAEARHSDVIPERQNGTSRIAGPEAQEIQGSAGLDGRRPTVFAGQRTE